MEAAGLPGVADLITGRLQFGELLCDCALHRRGGECSCSKCTYQAHNTMRLRCDMVN